MSPSVTVANGIVASVAVERMVSAQRNSVILKQIFYVAGPMIRTMLSIGNVVPDMGYRHICELDPNMIIQ